ncbi:Protein of unknown function [Pyronema omphalodes CBS 100304]|uniref:Uncharacterized protein n=1 Tax=Pyronema omphalodes (strain CBS 100304) TaxID=1076935 RepID=U4LCP1_PYROM|nr:Protein of unknown function [Pyronema omphalodes CBS 100304]
MAASATYATTQQSETNLRTYSRHTKQTSTAAMTQINFQRPESHKPQRNAKRVKKSAPKAKLANKNKKSIASKNSNHNTKPIVAPSHHTITPAADNLHDRGLQEQDSDYHQALLDARLRISKELGRLRMARLRRLKP